MTKFLNLKKLNHFKFSMIELVLCLVVVIVSIVGVMGLFPVGLESNKKTIGTSFATDAGEQFLRYNASKIRTDWTWTNVFANAKPGSDESHLSWNSAPIFNAGNVQIKATNDLNEAEDKNTGFFCLQQLTGENVDFTAVMRVWKDRKPSVVDNSEAVTLFVEVSWPASVPYDSGDRQKQQFSLEVFKAPDVSVTNTDYNSACAVTRDHGAGYSTTISSVEDNEDTTYTIELAITHDGCSGLECPELSHFSVEANENTYSDITFSGITGTLDEGYELSDDAFGGFQVNSTSAIGNGTAGTFIIEYMLVGLQEQEMVVHATTTTAGDDDDDDDDDDDNDAYSVTFTDADFAYVLSCTNQGSNFTSEANDDVYTLPGGAGGSVGTLSTSSPYGTLTVPAPGVLVNDTTSDGSQLTAVLVNHAKKGTVSLNADGSFTYVPDSDFDGTDKFIYKAFNGIKLTNVAQVQINAEDLCAWNNAPAWPSTAFALTSTIIEGQAFSESIAGNLATDPNGTAPTITLSNGPAWLSFDGTSFSGTPSGADTFTAELTATDSCGASATATVSIVVNSNCSSNQTPEWSDSEISITALLDQNLSESISGATDPDGDTLTYTLQNAPEWLSMNGSEFSGIPSGAGTFTATLTATDSCDASATTTLKIFVVDPCNLMVNGSFETHGPLSNGSWGVLTSWDGWRTTHGAGIEIQRNVAGAAYDGAAKVELDSHDLVQDGQNVPSNSWMAQDLLTTPGVSYTLEFYYSPRSCGNSDLCDASSNTVEVWWNGSLLETMSRSGLNNGGQTVWTKHTHTVVGGSGATTQLEFRAAGRENTWGGYIDMVSVGCANGGGGGGTTTPPASLPTVEFQSAASNGSEAQVNVPLNVVLSENPSDTVTVNYTVASASTAVSGSDYNLPSGVLTFTPGETTKTIPLNVINDSTHESDETVIVLLSSPSNATLGTVTQHTYTINDDDNSAPGGGGSGATVLGGDLNANPANSNGNIFVLTKSDGTELDMKDMSAYFSANNKTNLSYNGGASEVKIKVKAQGRTITIDGVDVELETNTRYTFSGNMTVNLRNTKNNPSKWGKAKGHWWIFHLRYRH